MNKVAWTALGMVLALGGCALTPKAATPVMTAVDECSDLTASIYFERDSTTLTRDAKAVLKGAAEQARGCAITSVDVYGLADPVGTPKVNMAISDARAKVVTAELTRLGVAQVNYRMVAAGEAGAMTADGEVRPLRRRADIIFRVAQGQ